MGFDVAKALLSAPGGRKKKRYVLHLLKSLNASSKEIKVVVKAVVAAMPDHTLIRLDDPDEVLKVVLLKNIELVILDTSFLGEESLSVEFASEIKKRKKVPILFTTKNENKLIAEYRAKMHLYEEVDDYLVTPVDGGELFRKLQKVSLIDSRAAKRFAIGSKAKVLKIDDGTVTQGKLTDLSLVGFHVEFERNFVLERNAQIKIEIPLVPFHIFHPQYGDWLGLAGRVRRVAIHGSSVGCSFEHLTPMQSDCLSRLLEQVARQNRLNKLQGAKT